jgi:hypothetical protein
MKKTLWTFLMLAAVFLWIGGISLGFPVQKMKTDGIEYMSGGVGMDEREEMEAMAKEFNVKAIFAEASGDYLANVMVTIAKASGEKVVDLTSDGPWLLAKLPPGQYSITAVYKGTAETQTIDAGQGLKSVLFVWKP